MDLTRNIVRLNTVGLSSETISYYEAIVGGFSKSLPAEIVSQEFADQFADRLSMDAVLNPTAWGLAGGGA